MGTLRKILSLAEPDQPVELWLIAIVKLLDGSEWACRVLVKSITAKEFNWVNRSIPRSCNQNNPLVAVKVIGDLDAVFTTDKMEFINTVINVPLMPDINVFYKRYKEFLEEYIESLHGFSADLQDLRANLNNVVTDIDNLAKPAQ